MERLKQYCEDKQLYYFMNGYEMHIELGTTTIMINQQFMLDMTHFPRMGVNSHYWKTLRDIMSIMEDDDLFEAVGTE